MTTTDLLILSALYFLTFSAYCMVRVAECWQSSPDNTEAEWAECMGYIESIEKEMACT